MVLQWKEKVWNMFVYEFCTSVLSDKNWKMSIVPIDNEYDSKGSNGIFKPLKTAKTLIKTEYPISLSGNLIKINFRRVQCYITDNYINIYN